VKEKEIEEDINPKMKAMKFRFNNFYVIEPELEKEESPVLNE
jgi:hypothetical protein